MYWLRFFKKTARSSRPVAVLEPPMVSISEASSVSPDGSAPLDSSDSLASPSLLSLQQYQTFKIQTNVFYKHYNTYTVYSHLFLYKQNLSGFFITILFYWYITISTYSWNKLSYQLILLKQMISRIKSSFCRV